MLHATSKLTVMVYFIAIFHISNAQVIQEELVTGHRKTAYTHIFETKFGQDDQYTFSNFGFFYTHYHEKDQAFDELGVQAAMFRDIYQGLQGGVALYYNSIIGLQKKVSLQYSFRHKPFFVRIRPSLVRVNGHWDGMVFLNAMANQPLTDDWHLYAQVRLQMYWQQWRDNTRGFQRIRLGTKVKDVVKFGFAIDYDQFKAPEQRETLSNYGLFLQKTF